MQVAVFRLQMLAIALHKIIRPGQFLQPDGDADDVVVGVRRDPAIFEQQLAFQSQIVDGERFAQKRPLPLVDAADAGIERQQQQVAHFSGREIGKTADHGFAKANKGRIVFRLGEGVVGFPVNGHSRRLCVRQLRRPNQYFFDQSDAVIGVGNLPVRLGKTSLAQA